MNKPFYFVFIALALLLLTGCHQPVLTSRPEDEANAALATLARAGVPARKTDLGRGAFSVLVPASKLEHALEVLSIAGLPRAAVPGIAEFFPEPGLVRGATEERARYNLALAGELSMSLRRLSGVRDARVHLALPKERARRLDRAPQEPSKASVLMLVEPDRVHSIEEQSDSIRELVAGAVAGLEPMAVSVVITAAAPFPDSIQIRAEPVRPAMLATGMSTLAIGLGLACFLLVRGRRGERENE